MKHPSTKELFDYWNTRRGPRPAPDRGDIEPGAIRRVLADTFILSFDERAGHPFRIAGTRVCAMFGRELKNESYVELWTPECRQLARDLVTVVASEAVGVVASARGIGADRTARDLEILLLPISHRGRTDVRVLGALVPAGNAGAASLWVGVSTLTRLTLGTLRYLGQGVPRPAALRGPSEIPVGRIRHGFVVYDGGQANR